MARPVRDLTKEGPFGRLRAIESLGRKYGGNTYFLCVCKCGGTVEAKGSHLVSGNVQSCGCLAKETCAETGRKTGGWNKTHGASGTPTFRSWAGMVRRCTDQQHPSYEDYGGAGISVCERWLDFTVFLADMGERPEGTTLNRLDNSQGYKSGNCEWATQREQHNNRSNTIVLAWLDMSMPLIEWSDWLGVNPKTLQSRHRLGWSDEKILSTPIKERTAS